MGAFTHLSIALALQLASSSPALRGLDPVELCAGNERSGQPAHALEHFGFRYHFASAENRQRFLEHPDRYEIQMGGACGSMGPLSGEGSAERYCVWDGRIYVFASDACRNTFLQAPQAHVHRDAPPLSASDEERALGREWIERMVESMGGASALDGVATAKQSRRWTHSSQGRTYQRVEERWWGWPEAFLRVTAWDDQRWTYLAHPQDSFRTSADGRRALHPSAVEELRREFAHDPLFLARARGLASFEAAFRGRQTQAGGELAQIDVRLFGVVTRLSLEAASGRPLRTAWHGRIATARARDVEVQWSDFAAVGALTLPGRKTVAVDGRASQEYSGELTWELDPVDAAQHLGAPSLAR
jgi:YHS domain-containing protein